MLKQLAKFLQTKARHAGFDVVRHRSLNTSLAHHGINLILDVGANNGQYGRELRGLGYKGRIVSFEPQAAPFAVLAASARRDGNWEAVNVGLGSADSQQEINVYQDSRLSSMLTFKQSYGMFESEKVGTETIQIRTVDGMLDQYAKPGDKILLKIDTQGFEKPVLAGAERWLPQLTGIQIELSITPLYADQPFLEEFVMDLRGKGFMLWQMIGGGPILMATGQELEVDGLFVRIPAPQG